jgi:hypothetical protein
MAVIAITFYRKVAGAGPAGTASLSKRLVDTLSLIF